MTKKPKKKARRERGLARPMPPLSGGIRLVTPEGAPLVFASARYRHADPDGIRQVLSATEDFDAPGPDEAASEKETFSWLQGGSEAGLFGPTLGRRILASLTLTPMTLEIEAMSNERLANCRKRLESLLGERIRVEAVSARGAAQALRAPRPKPAEPFLPPPELVAQIEEALLKKWISEPIPALGGLTPLQAVKTPAGRQRVLDLIADAEPIQRAYKGPGFAPDYRKAKKLLGLE